MEKNSLGLARHARELNSDTIESCYVAGLEALERGDVTQAQDWADRCSGLPASAKDARCAALQGKIAAARGDFEEAADHLRKAIRLAPHETSLARQLIEVLQTA